jgi:hypothetical protein
MRFNLNSGYGQALAASLPLTLGKIFVVANTSVVNVDNLRDIFIPDADGELRFFETITLALAQTVANRGDLILVAPNHSETVTAPITVNKAGVSIIGLGSGTLRPRVIVNGAVDGMTITAANVTVDNIYFPAPETDNATAMINVAAANVTIKNIKGIGSQTAKNFVDCITLASGADDVVIDGVELFNTTVAVNSFLSIEAAVARPTVQNFYAFGDVVASGIIDAATATQIHFKNITIGVVGTSKAAATLDSNPTGLVENCKWSGTVTTLATNAALGNAVRIFENRVLEETGGAAQGAVIPAVDAE